LNNEGIPPDVKNVGFFGTQGETESHYGARNNEERRLMSGETENPTSKPDKTLEEREIDRLAAVDADRSEDDGKEPLA